jgi:hypothetical protein
VDSPETGLFREETSAVALVLLTGAALFPLGARLPSTGSYDPEEARPNPTR